MGGNNPLVIWDAKDLHSAATMAVQSAYLSAGQRCTAARRLIVATASIESCSTSSPAGRPADRRPSPCHPAPFMGPVIDNDAADQLQEAFLDLMGKGGRPIRRLDRVSDELPFLTPGLIDVTEVERRPTPRCSARSCRSSASPISTPRIAEANCHRYGLSAS
jgi:succinylglutamic semialdehyde dehydrogenase